MEKQVTKESSGNKGRILTGTVVSSKMKKTIVVEVNRFVKHRKYKKFIKVTKRFKAHDENNVAKEGDKVDIRECRPISKDKHFELVGRVGGEPVTETV